MTASSSSNNFFSYNQVVSSKTSYYQKNDLSAYRCSISYLNAQKRNNSDSSILTSFDSLNSLDNILGNSLNIQKYMPGNNQLSSLKLPPPPPQQCSKPVAPPPPPKQCSKPVAPPPPPQHYSKPVASNLSRVPANNTSTITNDNLLDAHEMYDLVKKAGGTDGKISYAELNAALNNPNSNLTQDQVTLGKELFKVLKTMEGTAPGVFSKGYTPGAGLSFNDLLELSDAQNNNGCLLSLTDLAKNNSIWSDRSTNNDGQLGINELFANNGKGNYSCSGFMGYFSNGDGKISMSDLRQKLAHGAISPDERRIAEALVKYLQTKRNDDSEYYMGMRGYQSEPFVTAAELKQLMSADSKGSDMSLSVSDIEAATAKMRKNNNSNFNERYLTGFMKQNFHRLDRNHDGYLSTYEINLAGQLSSATNASDTFINYMDTGYYGEGLIYESIDSEFAEVYGISQADLNEVMAEQKMGKTLKQIAVDAF